MIRRRPARVFAPDAPRGEREPDTEREDEREELRARRGEHAHADEDRERRQQVAQPVEDRVDGRLRLEFRI
ncbi:MAG: hypothetical protein AB7G51_14885, partial [Steroidobacteraceae bacterium]